MFKLCFRYDIESSSESLKISSENARRFSILRARLVLSSDFLYFNNWLLLTISTIMFDGNYRPNRRIVTSKEVTANKSSFLEATRKQVQDRSFSTVWSNLHS